MTYGFKFNNNNGELVIDDSNVKPWYFTGSIAGTSNFFGQNYKNLDVTYNAYEFGTFTPANGGQQPSSDVTQPYYTQDTWKVYELRYIAPTITDCFFAYTLPRSNDTGIWYFTQDAGLNMSIGATAGAGPIHLLNNPKIDTVPYPGTGEYYVSIFAIVPDRFNLTAAQLEAAVPKVYFFSNKEIANNIRSTGYGLQVFDNTAKCMYDSGKLHIQFKGYSFQEWNIPPPPYTAGPDYNGASIRTFPINTSNPPSNTAFVIPASSQYFYREEIRSEGTLGVIDIHRTMVQRVDSGTDTGSVSTLRTRTIKVTSPLTQSMGLGITIPGVAPNTWWNYGANSYNSWLGQTYNMNIIAVDTTPLERGYTASQFPSTFSVTVNKTTVLEGNDDSALHVVIFTLTTSRVDTGSQIGYTITGTNITVDDIRYVYRNNVLVLPTSLTGFFTVNNNIGTINLVIKEDYITEGNETLTLTLNNGLSSASVSLTEDKAYSLSFATTPDTTTAGVPGFNEEYSGFSKAVIFQLKTKNVTAGTLIPWSILNISTDVTDFDEANSGNFTIENAPGLVSQGFNGYALEAIVLKKDLKTEGTETARIRLTDIPSVYLNFDIIDNSTTPIPVFNMFNPSSQNTGAVYLNEGTEYTWTITATNLPSGTVVYPRIIANTAGFADLDLSPWYSSGSYNGVALNANGTVVFKMTPVADVLLEGTENFTVALDYPLNTRVHTYPGTVFIYDTSKPPEVYSVSASILNSASTQFANENEIVRITITSSLDYGHPVHWTWEGVDLGTNYGEISLADISSMRYFDPETNISGGPQYTNFTPSLQGTFSFPTSGLKSSNLQFAVDFIINNEGVTEQPEYAQFYLRPEGGYTGSTNGSVGFFIRDVPIATYSVAPNVTSINEGGTLIWTITTENVVNGTTIYWQQTGTNTAADYNDNLDLSTVVINNNTATITRVVKADAAPYEGPETAGMNLFTYGPGGTVVPLASSATIVTINDTSIIYQNEVLTISPSMVTYPNATTLSITGGTPNTVFRYSLDSTSYSASATLDANGSYYNPSAGPGEVVGSHTVYVKFDSTQNTRQASWSVVAAATYALTPSVNSVNEGGSFTISFSTNQSGSFAYTITGVTSADINGAALSGTVSNGSVITYTVTAEATTEGTEYFNFALNNGQASAPVTFNDTSTTVYNEVASVTPTSVVYPNSVTISITGGIPNGSFRFSVNNTSYDSPVYSLDASGNWSNPNAGSSFNPGNYTVYFYFIDTGHTRQTPTWTVTTPAPTYSFYRDYSLRNEGEVINYTITTTNVANGTRIYWINYGDTDANDFTSFTNQGFVTINNNSGTFFRQLRNDATTEGEETVWIFFYDDAGYNNNIGYVGQTTVYDTSQTVYPAAGTFISQSCAAYGTAPYTLNKVYANGSGGTYTEGTNNSPTCGYVAPTYSLTASAASVNEGGSFTITFSTNQGGSFPYTITGVTSADINGASLTGSAGNGAVLTYSVTADSSTEGTEYFTITLDNYMASAYVTFNDTSVAPVYPAYGTVLSQGCVAYGTSPYTYRVTKANGSGGSFNEDTNNSTSCGYVAPPAAGTLLSQYCDANYTRWGTYADGSGGSYNQVIQYNAAYCGYTPPAASAPLVTSVTVMSGTFYPGDLVEAIINFSGPITATTYLNVQLNAGGYGVFYVPNGTASGGFAPSYGYGGAGENVEMLVGATSAYYAGPVNPGQLYVGNARLSAKTVTATSGGSDRQAYIQSSSFRLETGIAP